MAIHLVSPLTDCLSLFSLACFSTHAVSLGMLLPGHGCNVCKRAHLTSVFCLISRYRRDNERQKAPKAHRYPWVVERWHEEVQEELFQEFGMPSPRLHSWIDFWSIGSIGDHFLCLDSWRVSAPIINAFGDTCLLDAHSFIFCCTHRDHRGVSNAQLATEDKELGKKYSK